jgi:hypothetical protein
MLAVRFLFGLLSELEEEAAHVCLLHWSRIPTDSTLGVHLVTHFR